MRPGILKVGIKESVFLVAVPIGRRQVVVVDTTAGWSRIALSKISKVVVILVVVLFTALTVLWRWRGGVMVLFHIPNPSVFSSGDWKVFAFRAQPFAVVHVIYWTADDRFVIAMIAARGLSKAMGK